MESKRPCLLPAGGCEMRHSSCRGLHLSLASSFAFLAFLLAASPGQAERRYVPDQVIVKYKPAVQETKKRAVRDALGGGPRLADARCIDAELLRVQGMSVEAAIDVAKRDPAVAYAE